MPYEIERKYLVKHVPKKLSSYSCFRIEQGYLNTHPTVRIRKENNQYYLTYKNGSGMVHEEYNLPLDAESYIHMKEKCDGLLIKKNRYHIPLSASKKSPALTIELDVFSKPLAPLIYAEVEFSSEEEANVFIAPSWFGKEVTLDTRYTNSSLSQFGIPT
jgi:CYTH domain-containing protein